MKRWIVPFLMVVLLAMAVMTPASSAVDSRVISGRPTLRINGDTAQCEGIFRSGNTDNKVSVTLTLKYGTEIIDSWKASGDGFVMISESKTILKKGTYSLILSATVNGDVQPEVVVTAQKS